MSQTCSVPKCKTEAVAEVRLYDVYRDGTIFDEQDFTCPFICASHIWQNEGGMAGERNLRGISSYPFTNQHRAQGFTIYRALADPSPTPEQLPTPGEPGPDLWAKVLRRLADVLDKHDLVSRPPNPPE
jgi:hypothetical protein